MYPNWIIQMFTNNPCPTCRGTVMLDDINAIGACRPSDFESHFREPLVLVIAKCPHCGQDIHITMRCPTDLILDAARALAEQIEAAPPEKPPFFAPTPTPAKDHGSTDGAVGNAFPPTVKPSIRVGQNLGPPTEAEIKSFLARLKRMSFKPGSKSFDRLTGGEA